MSVGELFFLIGHFALTLSMCVFGLHRAWLAFRAWQLKDVQMAAPKQFATLPTVTIQLPLFNEDKVALRLIDAVAAFDYPKDKLQVQVLDDSTDSSAQAIQARVEHLQSRGVWIDYIHRTDRQGYKAGALRDALPRVAGDYIAIFDADFVPPTDFLTRMIHHFTDDKIGMVQSRWEHLNRQNSVLTELQAIMLDAHFAVDQVARSRSDLFFNFNGTAGMWRKQAIIDAGGWQADTITEDLDLSYRAQIAGWKFQFDGNVACPGELPPDMPAFKSQQHRWAKGSIEVFLKLIGPIWRSGASPRQKIEASLHLSANLSYLLMLTDCLIFLIPSISIRESLWPSLVPWMDVPLFLSTSLSHIYFYFIGQRLLRDKLGSSVKHAPGLMAIAISLAVNNGRAVIEALLRKKSAFIRTPKQGSTNATGTAVVFAKKRWGFTDRMEMILVGSYGVTLSWALASGIWVVLPFLLLITYGFLFARWRALWGRPVRISTVAAG